MRSALPAQRPRSEREQQQRERRHLVAARSSAQLPARRPESAREAAQRDVGEGRGVAVAVDHEAAGAGTNGTQSTVHRPGHAVPAVVGRSSTLTVQLSPKTMKVVVPGTHVPPVIWKSLPGTQGDERQLRRVSRELKVSTTVAVADPPSGTGVPDEGNTYGGIVVGDDRVGTANPPAPVGAARIEEHAAPSESLSMRRGARLADRYAGESRTEWSREGNSGPALQSIACPTPTDGSPPHDRADRPAAGARADASSTGCPTSSAGCARSGRSTRCRSTRRSTCATRASSSRRSTPTCFPAASTT